MTRESTDFTENFWYWEYGKKVFFFYEWKKDFNYYGKELKQSYSFLSSFLSFYFLPVKYLIIFSDEDTTAKPIIKFKMYQYHCILLKGAQAM